VGVGAPMIPETLYEQLKVGGYMVILMEQLDTAFCEDEIKLVRKIDDQGMVYIIDDLENPFYHVHDIY